MGRLQELTNTNDRRIIMISYVIVCLLKGVIGDYLRCFVMNPVDVSFQAFLGTIIIKLVCLYLSLKIKLGIFLTAENFLRLLLKRTKIIDCFY